MHDEELLHYNQLGLIPGPRESREEFIKRAAYSLTIASRLELPIKTTVDASICAKLQQLYDISPTWVPVITDKKGLSPWHGGSTWIFQLQEDDPLCALIQIHPRCNPQKREEILQHELCHVGRLAFEEPQFEEMIASLSSSSYFGKLGALVHNKKETFLFMLSILLVFWVDLYVFFNGTFSQMIALSWIKLIPLSLFLFALGRKVYRQRQWKAALQHISSLSHHPLAVLYRLADREIVHFSQWKEDEIKKYIKTQETLRWHLIRLAYFNNVL